MMNRQETFMKLLFFYLIFSFMFLLGCNKKSPTKSEPDPETFLTPQQVIGNIMRGINIGNTLEPPDEGGWNNGPLQEYYFDDYESAGFTCIRIPVKWGTHTSESSPFNIDPSWIDRVEQVVDWGLERDLYIIINGHHEDWLKNDYSPANQARYDSIWSQISGRFKDKSPRLMFEMINEPYGLTLEQINDLNFRILSIIRKTNPETIGGLKVTGLNDSDGFQFGLEDGGWLLIRFSGTEPKIKFYIESPSIKKNEAILSKLAIEFDFDSTGFDC